MRNSSVCVDANLVYRLVADPDDEPVRRLWQRWEDEHRSIAAPTLLWYEITNALHRAQRAGLMSPSSADAALRFVLAMPLQFYGDPALHAAALAMAQRFALPAAYDAHYLALAERLGAEFWTADARLANTVRPTLNWVHLLGEPEGAA